MMGGPGSMSADMMGWMGAMGAVWLLVGIAVLVLTIVGIALVARRLRTGDAPAARTPPDPVGELGRRYARGEIDRETYLGMRRDLDT